MPPSPFLEAVYRHMLAHHYGRRTADSYLYWIRFFIRFHNKRHPQEMGAQQVMAFLDFLANERQVSVSTQKIALNALAFLYNKYLQKTLGDLGTFNKASRPRKLPVVLTRTEVSSILGKLSGTPVAACFDDLRVRFAAYRSNHLTRQQYRFRSRPRPYMVRKGQQASCRYACARTLSLLT